MATSQIKNAQEIFVGGTATLSTLTNVADGEVAIFDESGLRVVAAGAGAGEINSADVTRFKLGLGRAGNNVLFSDIIEASTISNVNWSTYSARVNQVTTIGSNGTTGSIDVTANNLYYVRLYVQELLSAESDGQKIKHGVFKSTSSSDQQDIAIGLAKSIYQNFLREAEQYVSVEVLCDSAGVALGTGVDDVVFTKGSTKISATDIDDATTNPALVVGGFLRIGTAVTDPVYKIVEIDAAANTATLDAPFREDSQTIADTGLESITAAAAASANWGIKLSGADLEFGAPDYKYDIARWETQLENFGSTDLSETIGNPGKGTYESIASLEHFLKGFQGEIYRMGSPNIFSPILVADSAVAGGGYDVITFKHNNSIVTGSFTNEVSPKQVIVAFPATAPNWAISATADGFAELLEDLSGTALNVS
jgi:hypothetical protein